MSLPSHGDRVCIVGLVCANHGLQQIHGPCDCDRPFCLDPILFRFGIESTLLLPGQTTPYTYSDMNGYGHFVPALLWSLVYWTAIFAVLGVISIAFARRGAEDGWRPRIRQAGARLPRLTPAMLFFAVIAIGSGWWFYYNAHVLNEYLTTKQQRANQATTNAASSVMNVCRNRK